MTFDSAAFLILFAVVIVLYYRLPSRWSNGLLLVASYFFYGWWNPLYLILLFGSSAVDFLMVLLMDRSRRTRTLWLVISLVSNFGLLAVFKYAGFLADNLNLMLGGLRLPGRIPPLDILLPIGISFHTFQSMSYTIDAWRGTIPVERNFVRFMTFVSFFPQLVAGPIERASHLLPQFRRRADFDYSRAVEGCRRILWGLFKKMV